MGLPTEVAASLGLSPEVVPHELLRAAAERAVEQLHAKFKELMAIKWGDICKDHGDIKQGLQALLRAAVVQVWTGFECVAADVWEEALNLDPALAQKALHKSSGSSESPAGIADGLTSKAISVALLGKYGFDLRRKMGTVLLEKFPFGKVEGARRAYAAAFGREAPPLAALNDRELLRLEATRHVIVHRGGVIDDDYLRVVSGPEVLGTTLELNVRRVATLFAPGVNAGCALLEFAASRCQ